MKTISRRQFVTHGTIAALGIAAMPTSIYATEMGKKKHVRLGIIGTGGRGTGLIQTLLNIQGHEIIAVCDLVRSRADNAADLCVKAGKKRPAVYCKDTSTWTEMLDKEKQLDAVIIATYWEYHTPMGLYAMKNGIIPGIEVPAALTLDEAWSLVDTPAGQSCPVKYEAAGNVW